MGYPFKFLGKSNINCSKNRNNLKNKCKKSINLETKVISENKIEENDRLNTDLQSEILNILKIDNNGFTIRFIKQWEESMILNLNSLDEDIIGFELQLDNNADPVDFKISMYTATPNDPKENNTKSQIYSERIYDRNISLFFDDLNIIKPQWITLLTRKSGLSTDEPLDVKVNYIRAINKAGERIDCYPCWFNNTEVRIDWDLNHEVFKDPHNN